MSYLAFARKWRPSRFSDVVGQPHVITTLQNAIAVQRIGHAYLFSGPRGVGKTTIARILAKTVNCQQVLPEAERPEPCNECTTCTQINSGKSFDVIEIDAASNRGIDEIRELRENVKLAPALCRFKVYIIDEVHMLTQEAFNALLKTLEEPPAHVIFILATTERHKIPLTILSRCQPFHFSFIPHTALVERLRIICQDEHVVIDDDSLAIIAEQSEGCLRDAQNILEQLTASAGNKIDGEQVHRWLGLGSQYLIDQLIQAILTSDLQAALRAMVSLSGQGADLCQCLRKLIVYFADLRRLKIDATLDSSLNISASSRDRMLAQTEECSQEHLTRSLHALVKASNDIRQYGFEQLQIESALVTICRDVVGVPISQILAKLSALEARLEGQTVVSSGRSDPPGPRPSVGSPVQSKAPRVQRDVPPPQVSAPPAISSTVDTSLPDDEVIIHEELDVPNRGSGAEPEPQEDATTPLTAPAVDVTDAKQVWRALLETLSERKHKVIATYIREGASPVQISDGELRILFHRRAVRQMLDESDEQLVQEYLSEIAQRPMHVVFETTAEVEEEDTKPSSADKTHWARVSDAQRDETVRMVLQAFNGQVIDVQTS